MNETYRLRAARHRVLALPALPVPGRLRVDSAWRLSPDSGCNQAVAGAMKRPPNNSGGPRPRNRAHSRNAAPELLSTKRQGHGIRPEELRGANRCKAGNRSARQAIHADVDDDGNGCRAWRVQPGRRARRRRPRPRSSVADLRGEPCVSATATPVEWSGRKPKWSRNARDSADGDVAAPAGWTDRYSRGRPPAARCGA